MNSSWNNLRQNNYLFYTCIDNEYSHTVDAGEEKKENTNSKSTSYVEPEPNLTAFFWVQYILIIHWLRPSLKNAQRAAWGQA